MSSVVDGLVARLNANFSLVSVTTPEEARAELIIFSAAQKTKRGVYVWSITQGLRELKAGEFAATTVDGGDPSTAAKLLAGGFGDQRLIPDKSIVVLLDFGPYLKDPVVIRAIRDAIPKAKESLITGVFLGAQLELPPELRREVVEVELALPGEEEIRQVVGGTVAANQGRADLKPPTGEHLVKVVEAARGLTTTELENALLLSIVSTRQIEASVVSAEKAKAIKVSGALEVLEPPVGGLDAVGGLGAVKEWVRTRGRAFSPEAKKYGLPNPKGCLLVGVPGCGKSLAAKAAAASLEMPLVRLDVAAVFGGLVGESETNVRQALKTLDAVAPCVCMVDELEKAFAGSGAGKSTDSGTSSRVLGTFLTWMQEHTSPVFLLATANDVTSLPPEMLRRGRWDSMMFVDLPSPEERAEIFRIHLEKRRRSVKDYDLPFLVGVSEGFSGAELEEAVIGAMFGAFADGGREFTSADINVAVQATVPLSRTMGEQIGALRDWAKARCTPASGRVAQSSTPAAKVGRRAV